MLAAQRAARVQPQPVKKKAQSSARGSEERQTSVSAAAPRGQKRMRDNDLEKVSVSDRTCNAIPTTCSAHQQASEKPC
jgi:mortality factor 4-like protein 1